MPLHIRAPAFRVACGLTALGFLAILPASAQSYTITDLGTLGGATSHAYGLNSHGDVVGTSEIAVNEAPGRPISHAFLYHDGAMTDLSTLPGCGNSTARSLNDSGEATGFCAGSPLPRAFVYRRGTMTDLGEHGPFYGMGNHINNRGEVTGVLVTTPGTGTAFLYSHGQVKNLGTLGDVPAPGLHSAGQGLNDLGQVVGSSNSEANREHFHAFLDTYGRMIDLGTLNGEEASFALGINRQGQIIGTSDTARGDTHAFLEDHGHMTDLGTLGGNISNGIALNEHGDAVGHSNTVHNVFSHAFVYRDGKMMDLNEMISPASGWTLTSAVGINDEGQITGDGVFQNQTHAYLLTPVLWSSLALWAGPDGRPQQLWRRRDGSAALCFTDASGNSDTQIWGPYAGWNIADQAVDRNDMTYFLWSEWGTGRAMIWERDRTGHLTIAPVGPYLGWTAEHLIAREDRVQIVWKRTEPAEETVGWSEEFWVRPQTDPYLFLGLDNRLGFFGGI